MKPEDVTVIDASNAQRDDAWEACRAALGAGVSTQAAGQLERWVRCCDESLVGELVELARSAAAVEDAFYRDLAFGTGGLRGVIGAGTNRMNVHTVAKATQGLAAAGEQGPQGDSP